MGAGEPWDLYVNPKKKDGKDAKEAKPAPPSTDGTEMTVNPKTPKAPAPGGPSPQATNGVEEMPGNPRPKVPGRTSENPNGGPGAAESDAEFRRQAPRGAEEDAEVWDSRKGWTTPSGRKEGLAPGADGKLDTTPDAPVSPEFEAKMKGSVESDDDTEVITAPKRVLPPETRPRNATQIAQAKVGRDGQDFQEYQRPATPAPTMVGGVAPQHQSGSGFFGAIAGRAGIAAAPSTPPSAAPSPSAPASPFASLSSPPAAPPQQPPKLYGQSEVSLPSSSPRPSGHTEVYDPSARPGAAPQGTPGAQPAMAGPGQVHAKALPNGALNVLLVGSGAREHAMALALRRSQRCHLFVVMKHRNPGLAKSATGFKILDDRDAAGIVQWARSQKIHLAVAGPESSLEAGVTDALRAAGIAVASPSQAAARVETSKTFMRELMARHKIPGRLAFHPFTDLEAALAFLDENGPEWAIKPVGLTGGKGVQVYGDHFADLDGAKAYVNAVFASRQGGGALQFEELARGEEFTVMAFTDGATVLPMPAVQDHKRLLEGDEGPNTGGMGSYSCADGLLPFLPRADYDAAVAIVQGIVDALRKEGTPYVGTIYGQFMLTASGPKVIEVNARFGDPEAMNVLSLLESDYLSLVAAMATGTLAGQQARFLPAATVVKYVVPRGYGEGHPEAGHHVQVDDFNIKRAGGVLFMGAIEQQMSGPLVTLASRTLAVLGVGATLEAANAVCEASLRHVHGDGLHVRHDIGSAQLIQRRVEHMASLRPAAMGIRKVA
ncbi:MAG: phosphoribosylamine---glycine ligase [Thermoplasmata archaeon]|nr:phosphoribosylamine---glycine ligase [Thermoplasmata archaeon]